MNGLQAASRKKCRSLGNHRTSLREIRASESGLGLAIEEIHWRFRLGLSLHHPLYDRASVPPAPPARVMSWKRKLSTALRDCALAKIEQYARETIGVHVEIQNFALHLLTLTVNACGIILRGIESTSSLPLVKVDELVVNLKIVSVLRRKVEPSRIILRHPVVHVVAGNEGTNLPPAVGKNSGNSTSLFNCGIRHLLLTNGEIYFHDARTLLDVELHDTQLELKDELASNRYDGTFSCRSGQVSYYNGKALSHDLHANFSVSPSDLAVNPLVLTIASSVIQLEGNVHNYSGSIADATYKISIHPNESQNVARSPGIFGGTITLTGSLSYQRPGGESHDLKLEQLQVGREGGDKIAA